MEVEIQIAERLKRPAFSRTLGPPERIFVEVDTLTIDPREDHRPKASVTDGQGFRLPAFGGLVVVKDPIVIRASTALFGVGTF